MEGTLVWTPECPGVLEMPYKRSRGPGSQFPSSKPLREALLAGLYTRPTLDCISISFVIKHHAISLSYAEQLVYNSTSQGQVPDA